MKSTVMSEVSSGIGSSSNAMQIYPITGFYQYLYADLKADTMRLSAGYTSPQSGEHPLFLHVFTVGVGILGSWKCQVRNLPSWPLVE